MAKARRLQLRQIHHDEALAARAFWELHPSEYVEPRSVEVLSRAAKRGWVFVVELAPHWGACTTLLPVDGLQVVELSDTRVVDGVKGFGLQPDVLTPVRIATALMGELGSALVMVIDRKNATSMKNSAGFAEWTSPPKPLLEALDLKKDDPEFVLLRLPEPIAWQHVATFLQRLGPDNTVTLQSKKTPAESLIVELDIELVRADDARAVLEKAVRRALAVNRA